MALDIDEELSAVREKLGSLPECSLVTCQRAQVRVRVSQTAARTLDACVQFPDDFPEAQVLLELKSKSVAQRFLDSVVRQFEKEPRKYIAHPDGQVITAVRYVVDAVRANRLCICTDEIAQIRKLLDLDSPDTSDFLKIRQSKSFIQFSAAAEAYRLTAKIQIPDEYPSERVQTEIENCNFPKLFQAFFCAQAKEIARKCVERPVYSGKVKKKQITEEWHLRPSLQPVAEFLIQCAKRYPMEPCGLCDKRCFATNPDENVFDVPTAKLDRRKNMTTEEMHSAYLEAVSELIERVYCGHIFHHHCLDVYMKTPPFTGGKKCPKCQLVIYHEKWKETERTREERWAHQQAKQRELEESFNITLDEGCSEEILICLKDFHIQAATCVRSIFSNEFYAKYCHTHVVPIAQKWKKTSEHWHSMAGICLTQPNSDAPKTPILSMPNGPETPQKFEFDHDSSNLTRNGSKPDDLLACLVEVDSARLGCKEEVLKCKSVAACLGYGTWQLYISNLRHRQWFEYISKLRLFSDNSMNQMVHTIQSCIFSV